MCSGSSVIQSKYIYIHAYIHQAVFPLRGVVRKRYTQRVLSQFGELSPSILVYAFFLLWKKYKREISQSNCSVPFKICGEYDGRIITSLPTSQGYKIDINLKSSGE